MKKLWFRRKIYGWGWYPITWQGWLVTLVFAGAATYFAIVYRELFKFVAHDTRGIVSLLLVFLAIEAVLVGILLFICYKTGEPPKWSWGETGAGPRRKDGSERRRVSEKALRAFARPERWREAGSRKITAVIYA